MAVMLPESFRAQLEETQNYISKFRVNRVPLWFSKEYSPPICLLSIPTSIKPKPVDLLVSKSTGRPFPLS